MLPSLEAMCSRERAKSSCGPHLAVRKRAATGPMKRPGESHGTDQGRDYGSRTCLHGERGHDAHRRRDNDQGSPRLGRQPAPWRHVEIRTVASRTPQRSVGKSQHEPDHDQCDDWSARCAGEGPRRSSGDYRDAGDSKQSVPHPRRR